VRRVDELGQRVPASHTHQLGPPAVAVVGDLWSPSRNRPGRIDESEVAGPGRSKMREGTFDCDRRPRQIARARLRTYAGLVDQTHVASSKALAVPPNSIADALDRLESPVLREALARVQARLERDAAGTAFTDHSSFTDHGSGHWTGGS
jgi:hypothetical protein